ncbi:AsmA family protein [Chitinophaga lutea]
MPRWLRISLISAGSLAALIVLLYIILALVIRARKQSILADITEQLSSEIDGDLVIRDMEPSLLRGFPNISVTLKDVSLRDSLFNQHGHTLFAVKEIYVKVNSVALLRKQVDIRKVTLEDGAIYLYTDSAGYSNGYLLQGNKNKKPKSGKSPTLKDIEMEKMLFTLENKQKFKHFRFDIRRLQGKLNYNDTGWTCQLKNDMQILDMAFNTGKGSYAKNKTVNTDITIGFSKAAKTLTIPKQIFRFDGQPVLVDGQFVFSEKPPAFHLLITADKIPFRLATSLVTPNISSRLDSLDFDNPLDVKADIRGHMKFRDTPYVRVTWETKDNTLRTRNLAVERLAFAGAFLNELTPGMGHNDANSRLSVYGFRGEYDSIPVFADTIRVVNLQHPVLTGRFRSEFPLDRLNDALGTDLFSFNKGSAMVDLQYTGPWDAKDTTGGRLHGSVQIRNGAFTYLPRNQEVHECAATLDFEGHDLFLRNIRLRSGASVLEASGSARNFLNFYFSAPEKVLLEWTLRSPLINLNEFQSFFTQRKSSKGKKPAARKKNGHTHHNRVLRQLSYVLEACSVNMQLTVDRVKYRAFNAANVKAGLQMSQDQIRLQNAALQAAGGQLNLDGAIQHPGGDKNRFSLTAKVRQVQVDQLFRAFENFGQDAITANNLRGIFSATANVTGGMKADASIQPHSLYGTVNFDLNKGALLHFKPLEDVGKFVFRRRDMSNITFERLQNTLDLKGNKILIRPMQINSSVININLEGTYGMPKGTDIKLQVPLRNPKKDELVTDAEELQKRRTKGIVVNLHAVDGDDGKIKLKLGKGD